MAKRYKLGDADEMFRRFFDRWYTDDDRKHKVFPATRPDMISLNEWVGQTVADRCPYNQETSDTVLEQIQTMVNAATNDFKSYLPVIEPIDISWVKAFDEYYNLDRVTALAERCDPADYSNDYLILIIEFGAVIGHVLISLLPRLEWVAGWPYWESALFDSKTGHVIPVFHWAIKKFSTYGMDDNFEGKVLCGLQILEKKENEGREGMDGSIVAY